MATAAVEIPPSDRGVPGSHMLVPAEFPEVSPKHLESIDPQRVATAWVDAFNDLLNGQKDALGKLFLEDSYWRDFLCSTWDFHTFHGLSRISSVLKPGDKLCRLKGLKVDSDSDFKKPTLSSVDFKGSMKGVQAFLIVETDVGRGRGLVKLIPDLRDGGTWKAFTLFTTLEELKGHEESVYSRRPTGVDHGAHPGRLNWQQRRDAEMNCEAPFEPTVLIIGAGQAGLVVAARLKQLGVRALIIDRNNRVGDNWRNRYHQLVLHDSVWYDHMPYLNFPPNWPVYTPKDKLAEWFETYVKALELNVWTKTTLTASSWDDSKHHWAVTLDREIDGKTEIRKFHPRHIVLATGHSGEPYFPSHIKGLEDFKGDLLVHSSQFTGPQPNAKGKKAVIVGSCNSAHDIAQDYHAHGYHVTMIQRSSTLVITSETLSNSMKGIYSEDGPPTPFADILAHSTPNPVSAAIGADSTPFLQSLDTPLLSSLQAAGFRLDSGPSGTGIWLKYLHRGGGYYIDVGCSALIASHQIGVKSGHQITHLTSNSVVMADGEEIQADEIVFATGYKNMRDSARVILGDKVAGKVGDVWGFDEEGEVRGVWRRSGCEGFWFAGGNLALCRFFSGLLALQILGCEVGLCG